MNGFFLVFNIRLISQIIYIIYSNSRENFKINIRSWGTVKLKRQIIHKPDDTTSVTSIDLSSVNAVLYSFTQKGLIEHGLFHSYPESS